MPPGVFVSSTVGVSGAGTVCDSLLGMFPDWLLRCFMLSYDDEVSLLGLVVATFLGGRLGNSACGSVGVGGVTKVVGVSVRFGGVAGRESVLTRGLPRLVGVTGRSPLFSTRVCTAGAGACAVYATASATFCAATISSGILPSVDAVPPGFDVSSEVLAKSGKAEDGAFAGSIIRGMLVVELEPAARTGSLEEAVATGCD